MTFRIAFNDARRDFPRLSDIDRDVITHAALCAGLEFVVVTRTASTPEEQAKAMYENCIEPTLGPASQKRLYGDRGDLVIDVYEDMAGKGITSAAAIIDSMARMIRKIGPEKVSHHCVDQETWKLRHVIDLSAGRMPEKCRPRFEYAIVGDHRVLRHFSPFTIPSDPAFHIEVDQVIPAA